MVMKLRLGKALMEEKYVVQNVLTLGHRFSFK
jgi:hypothetical protein